MQDEIDAIRGKRLGITAEIERVMGIVSSPIDPNLADGGIEELNARVGGLPQSLEEATVSERGVQIPGFDVTYLTAASGRFADGFLVGVRKAREDAVWQINRLKQFRVVSQSQTQPNRAAALFQLRQLYKSLSTRNRILINQRGVIQQ